MTTYDDTPRIDQNTADPARAALLRRFADNLEDLRYSAGKPSYHQLARAESSLRTSTISNVLRGATNPTLDFVLAFVRACSRHAQAEHHPIDAIQSNDRFWREEWLRLQRALQPLRRCGRRPGLVSSSGTTASTGRGPVVPRMLPADCPIFAGHDAEIRALDDLWADDGSDTAPRIAVLLGMPGVGKTELAVHWAHRVRDRFPDGDLFVDLSGRDGYDGQPAELAMTMLLRALGATECQLGRDLMELTTLYRALTAGRRILLILDNVSPTEDFHQLIPDSANALVIMTCTAPPTTTHEATLITVKPLSDKESKELLTQVAGDSAEISPDVLARAAAVGGHLPLALRLVGESLHLPNTDSPTVLDLAAPSRSDLTDAASALDLSYRALDGIGRADLRMLGLHPTHEFGLGAITALLDVPPSGATDRVRHLVAAGLVAEVGPDRYRMHDLVYEFASERSQLHDSASSRTDAQQRLVNWYLRTADIADRHLHPARRHVVLSQDGRYHPPATLTSYGAALRWFDLESTNVIAATRLAQALGDHATAWQLPYAALPYLRIRKPFVMWAAVIDIATASARLSGDKTALGYSVYSEAAVHIRAGDLDHARSCLHEVAAIFEQINDFYGTAHVLVELSEIATADGRHADALRFLENAYHAASASQDQRTLELTCIARAEAAVACQDNATALASARQALELARQLGDSDGEGRSLRALAAMHQMTGSSSRATVCLEQAVAVYTRSGNHHGAAHALEALGQICYEIGDIERAREALSRALDIFDTLADPRAGQLATQLERIAEDLSDPRIFGQRPPMD